MDTQDKNSKKPSIPTVASLDSLTLYELFDKVLPNLYNYIHSKGLSYYDDDIVSEAFITYWLKSKEEEIKNPEGYLMKILFIKVKEYCRIKQRDQKEVFDIEDDPPACSKMVTENSFLINELNKSKKQKLEKLNQIIETHLNENQRRIIKMKFFQEMSTKEIGLALNKSEDSVRHILSRGKQKLKNLLN